MNQSRTAFYNQIQPPYFHVRTAWFDTSNQTTPAFILFLRLKINLH